MTHLKVGLNVASYRHLAAALGRYLSVGIIEDNEEVIDVMDAMAGRQTTTSDSIYGLQPNEVGRVNERILAMFRATARLWHKKVLHLSVGDNVASLKQILHPSITLEELSGKSQPMSSQPSDVTSIITQIKALFEDSVVNKIVPIYHQTYNGPLYDVPVDFITSKNRVKS